jgi:chemotaxis protein MotB
MKQLLFIIMMAVAFASCVSKKVLRQSQMETQALRNDSTKFAATISELKVNIDSLKLNITGLNNKITNLNNQNSQLDQQSATQQNQLNQTKLTLQQQQERLRQLENLLQQQKEKSDELKNKMAQALMGYNEKDLSIVQKNGKVYVSLSENLLFPSGSAAVNKSGTEALSKLAAVLNLNTDVAVNILGHTDSIPIRGTYKDNWDLSTARANSIIRILVNNYKVDPARIISSGHSSYEPIDVNFTAQGRANNRRTEIILSPKLEEMYKLLGY